MVVKSRRSKPNYKIPLRILQISFLYDARNEGLEERQPFYEKEVDITRLTKEELKVLIDVLDRLYHIKEEK